LCGYPHKNQRGLELKIILSIENDEEPDLIRAEVNNQKMELINHIIING